LSGPILDRIDLHVHLEKTDPEQLFASETETSSAKIRARVINARAFAKARAAEQRTTIAGSPPEVPQADLDEACKNFLIDSAKRIELSTRSLTRTLRVARTIADLDNNPTVGKRHIAEALAFRVQVHR
jgi:magnesium chelatase family protein